MNLVTALPISEVVLRLGRKVAPPPTMLQCIATLNVSYWYGRSLACGSVNCYGFSIRNRRGPGFSIEVIGQFVTISNGTRIEISTNRSFLAKTYQWTRDRREEQQLVELVRETVEADFESNSATGI